MKIPSSSATNLNKDQLSHFLNVNQFTKGEFLEWIELMETLKQARKRNAVPHIFKGLSLGMIFQQSSTRTRVSFETAATLLGGHALFLSPRDIHLGSKETIEDTARVVSRMVDVVMIRTDKYEDIEQFARYSTVPVINAMSTDVYGDDTGNHPTQLFADILTIKEHLPEGKKLEDATVVVIGDGSTPTVSLAYACSKLGMTFKVISPEGYNLPQHVIDTAEENNKLSGGKLIITSDINEILGADFIMSEEWCWGRSEEEVKKRDAIFKPDFVVTKELLEKAGDNTYFMHVLPANAGNGYWNDEKEVTREVMEGDRCLVFDEAENRLSAMMALLAYYSRPHIISPSKDDIIKYDKEVNSILDKIFHK
jgi:putrescine carbamoyltransferase